MKGTGWERGGGHVSDAGIEHCAVADGQAAVVRVQGGGGDAYWQPGHKMAPARRQRTQRLPGQKEAEARHKTPGPQGGAAGAKESVDGAGAAEARRSRGKGERASRPQEEKQQTKLKSRNIC